MTIEQMHEEIAAYCKGFKLCTDGCRLRNDNAKRCRWNGYSDESTEDCYHFLIAEGLIGKPEQPMSREDLICELKTYCNGFGMTCDGCAIENVDCGCIFERKSFDELKKLYDIAYPKEINFVKAERNDEIEQKNDAVNHPSHYTYGGIECIDAIHAVVNEIPNGICAFLTGQVIKYIWRWMHKDKPVEDLKKCRFYLDRLIENAEVVYGKNT